MRKPGPLYGFTLLELVVVIIIVGVLSSLALPRFFQVIELSRSTEALANLKAIRQAAEKCYYMNSGKIFGCLDPTVAEIENITAVPNAHFTYGLEMSSSAVEKFYIVANRNTFEGGAGAQNSIKLEVYFNGPDMGINTCGIGIYKNFGNGCVDMTNW